MSKADRVRGARRAAPIFARMSESARRKAGGLRSMRIEVKHLFLADGAPLGCRLPDRKARSQRRARVTTPETPKPMSSARS